MKVYICDCCGERLIKSYKEKMFSLYFGYDFQGRVTDVFKKKQRIDLCGDCWSYIRERKWKEE